MRALRILGIDPGLTNGGAAVIDAVPPDLFGKSWRFDLLAVLDIPTTGEDAKKRILINTWSGWIKKWSPEFCGIERAQSMTYYDQRTGQHRAQAGNFSYGRAVGYIEAAVLLANVKLFTVEPAVWKRAMALPGGAANKRASVDLMQRIFPRQADMVKLVKDNHKAEAALIAKFAADQMLQEYGWISAPTPAKRGKRGKAA